MTTERKKTVFTSVQTLLAGWSKLTIIGKNLWLIFPTFVRKYRYDSGELQTYTDHKVFTEQPIDVLCDGSLLSRKNARDMFGTDKILGIKHQENSHSTIYVCGNKANTTIKVFEYSALTKIFSEKSEHKVPMTLGIEALNGNFVVLRGEKRDFVGAFGQGFVELDGIYLQHYVGDKYILSFSGTKLCVFSFTGKKIGEIRCFEPALFNNNTVIMHIDGVPHELDLATFRAKKSQLNPFISLNWKPIWFDQKHSAYASQLVGKKYQLGSSIIHDHFVYNSFL